VELAIRTEHLTKVYGNRLIAVNDMSLEAPQGAVLGLLGPNGAGKTTTIRILLGLQRATAGTAEVFGRPCGPNAVNVRAMIGYLPTNPKLPGHLTPIEYLDLLGRLCRLPGSVRQPRCASLLRAVGLLDATSQKIRTFSTGMRTRLGIAASLVGDPPLLLWDEPTAGLDPAARRYTLDLIRKLGENRTIVLATHILSDIDQICDHVGVMHKGRMIFTGTMQEMKRKMRQRDFRLELEGDVQEVDQLVQEVNALEGVAAEFQPGGALLVRMADEQSMAGALSAVLQLVDARNLSLLSLQMNRNETENAYLQLLQEDEAHGFHRFDLECSQPVRPVSSDLPT